MFSEKYECFGAMSRLKSTDSITSSYKKLEKRQQHLKPAAILNRCYWQHMTQLCHRGIDWCALRPMNVCLGDFRIRGIQVPNNIKTGDYVPDNGCVSCCCYCREVAMNEKLIVQMDGKRTRIFNTKVNNSRTRYCLLFPPPFLSNYATSHLFIYYSI